ncbi:hypothetical protein [Ktedonospora formicarum]|uniref:Uncharacterized protein n=1 Tax=Ktedonospora formicarum TaxID=2778364 RepID=A0A8J3HVV6_9CHLR|nr:hypothetical protein [Ktedonospora formicarum]GHO42961.1 hypothetical protein KSX_11240 [Ktedonospora formicarum]
MGVERSVTRWYVERQMLLSEISALEADLNSTASEQETSANKESATSQKSEAALQLRRVQEKLHFLGPCPKSMMG